MPNLAPEFFAGLYLMKFTNGVDICNESGETLATITYNDDPIVSEMIANKIIDALNSAENN
jgi:hypothetical protein